MNVVGNNTPGTSRGRATVMTPTYSIKASKSGPQSIPYVRLTHIKPTESIQSSRPRSQNVTPRSTRSTQVTPTDSVRTSRPGSQNVTPSSSVDLSTPKSSRMSHRLRKRITGTL